ncbi:hypothetical protein F5Y18DRAFT_378705 [Xylariaceae sp. FL1019]|nr:hypothetical protein F5Y18DRAFT_378705 [Xylariaceae sp. FL1019]
MASQIAQGQTPLLKGRDPDDLPIITTPVDFAASPLAEDYSSFFAMTIDNLLTPEECAALQGAAGDNWKDLSKGDAYRECQQNLVFSHGWSSALFERIASCLPDEVKALRKGDALAQIVAGSSHLKANLGARKTVWRLKEANERLSFLRYQPGHFFKPHCDALYAREGKDEKSFLTCQIYLNDAPNGTYPGSGGGGETRFWATKKRKSDREEDNETQRAFLDVIPKMGKAVVFQQRMLWHSGQEVLNGEKFTVRLDLMYERHFERV